jgi:RNA polymerase sigma-70 factor (ECF subfamily)
MPPQPSWYLGIAQARAFLARGPLAPGPQRRVRLTHANGQLALGVYYTPTAGETHSRHVLDLLTLTDDGRIAAITAFVGADPQPFGLPAALTD